MAILHDCFLLCCAARYKREEELSVVESEFEQLERRRKELQRMLGRDA
jgi:hypothetical protein